MQSLITGGSGLVGSCLIADLIRKDENSKVLVRSEYSKKRIRKNLSFYLSEKEIETKFDKIEFVFGDILDFDAISDAMENVSRIYHAAAIVSFNPRRQAEVLKNNVDATANLVNLALDHNIDKFLFVSSIAAIGSAVNGNQANENTQMSSIEGRSIYSKSKFLAEMEVWRGVEEDLNAVIVNPSVILGPGDWNRSSSRFFQTIHNGMKFYTNGVTGYVDVRDVSKICVQLMNSEIQSERFILNAGHLSYKELFDEIADHLKVKKPQIYASKRLGNVARIVESAKTKILNTEPKITKETLKSAHSKSSYCTAKVEEKLNFSFRDLKESIKDISQMYLSDLNS